MKKALITLSGLSLFTAVCRAEFQVGDGALQLDTSLTGVYDSNLRASVNNIEDYYLSFQPTLRYRRPGARFLTEASAGLRIKRYLDTTTSNSEDADLRFDWDMKRADGHTTAATLGLRYFENTEANLDINDLVRTKTFSVNMSGEVLMAERNLLSAGLSYHDSERNLGSDQKNSNAHLGYTYLGLSSGSELNLTYSHQESVSTQNSTDIQSIDQTGDTISGTISKSLYDQLRGGLTYGYRWLDRGEQEALLGLASSKGSFFAVNLDGPFLPRQYFPKTTGTFRLSYERAETPGLNDRNNERLVGQVNISWAAREHTTVGLFANRSQDLSITDNTVVNESVGLTLRQGIGAFIDADFGLSRTNADFVNLNRTDNRYEARAGATYRINRTWSSGLTYRYLKSDSNTAVANYTRHIVSGTVNYAF
jgi:hypothetical protein